ncbi:hypothetical protein [Pyrodictium abyssi]|uniref:Uncharacterized protein n=1 Tax=Pyrodictium abyssi TaxID=54256 RepID=A0ABM8IYU7_9CREN|nr:hypothetical protein PABY_08340 [Pyrodictium abyssi]
MGDRYFCFENECVGRRGCGGTVYYIVDVSAGIVKDTIQGEEQPREICVNKAKYAVVRVVAGRRGRSKKILHMPEGASERLVYSIMAREEGVIYYD